MSLTVGTGPFGTQPAGRFNFEPPSEGASYLEAFPRRVRARLGAETVVDSRRARLLHEHGKLPVLWFPEEDVRLDLLPEEAVARHPDEQLAGFVSVDWEAGDEWLEEDDVRIGHVRDPYHRIDVLPTSRHVKVTIDGQVVAESDRTMVLFETGLPNRWYFPEEDVRMELLEPSETDTVCAYKGHASYWSVGGEDDVVWTYRDPLHDALEVKDRLAFFNERVEIDVDGEREPDIRTQWSRD